jgi:peptide/nickel transport system substrate-binding protein
MSINVRVCPVWRRACILLSISASALALATACGTSSSSPSSSGTVAAGTPQKGGTLTILASSAFGVADPAQNYTLQEWAFLIDTHDGLVQFKRVDGTEGTQLVPDLAEQIPQPTDGGKTYTFQVRKGIKFSDGTTMKPSDFVTTFERQFTVPGPTGFYSGIVGADKCSAKHCDLSQGVVADDNAYTLTIHLTASDPEFLFKLALPFAYVVPGNTSPKLTGNDVPPGTGPYMWQSYDPNKEAVLVRNPNFKVWNPDAQPDGYPDKIVEKYGLQVSDEVTAVENDQADVVFAGDTIPPDRLNELGTQYADQTHVKPLTANLYLALNTRRPPFNNLQARQAINYAAARDAYVKLYGGPSLAVPTCQILPPNFPGYVQYCPYTANPAANGADAWSAPNIAKAKQLVRQSGTTGMKVIVSGTADQFGRAVAGQMVSDLNKIGYRAGAKLLAAPIQAAYVANSRNNDAWHAAVAWWVQDYPAPSDFLNVLLGCGSIRPGSDASPNIAEYCNVSIQAEMDAALDSGLTDPNAANQTWAQIDHEMTDQAPWVPLLNPKQVDFLSTRVQGYQWNPQWLILIDQLWLKR